MFILDFFDETKDCKEELKTLKLQYFEELSNIDLSECKTCKRREIRDKFLSILLEGNYGF